MDFVEESGREWRDDLLQTATERFGRMLAEEAGRLRAEMAAGFAELRSEVAAEFAKVRVEMADGRAELLKWCFLFWIGQVAAVAALMAFMLRNVTK